MPQVTLALIVATVLAYFVETTGGEAFIDRFALWPLGHGFAPWQVVSYAFVHDTRNIAHLFFNMWGLYMFGSPLERFWGARRQLVYYTVSVLSAAIVQIVSAALSGSPYPTVGASGGVFGLLLAFALFFPQTRVMLLFPPIPMPAWLFATLYGALELVLGVTGTQEGVAHFAHLGGMLGGYLLIRQWRSRRAR
jgi:membrane associated rhomboid family serine protease